MKTQTKQTGKKPTKRTPKPQTPPFSPFKEGGEFVNIDVDAISFSPFNYRSSYSKKALEDFAAELAVHHVISPVTVRPVAEGKFELVAGERRLRASRIAGLSTIPAVIRELTDEQVTEIQLSENIQRENPHPLQEAGGINRMKDAGYTIEEIAARLGKSKAYVYSRLKLLSLIPSFQELLQAEKLSLQDALRIAQLSPESQEDFYNEECAEWADEPEFELELNHYLLRSYHCDLHQAPFDTGKDDLLEKTGACTHCPSNTATLQTLFPEISQKAVCTNRSCFQKKCTAHHTIQLAATFAEHHPVALIYYGTLPVEILEALKLIPEAADLPHRHPNQVNVWNAPVPPDKQDYIDTNEDEEETFDEASFQDDWQEYELEKAEYEKALQSGELLKGLFMEGNHDGRPVWFSPQPEMNHSGSTTAQIEPTAKAVQEALKAGTATPELLHGEIRRINNRETRSLEIDREKVQTAVHAAFTEISHNQVSRSLTKADQVAARILVYQTLSYGAKSVLKQLIPPPDTSRMTPESTYDWLAGMSEEVYSTMIRLAIAGKPEAKSTGNETAYCLYKVAEQAGTDVSSIEKAQKEIADKRTARQKERIRELEKKMETIK